MKGDRAGEGIVAERPQFEASFVSDAWLQLL